MNLLLKIGSVVILGSCLNTSSCHLNDIQRIFYDTNEGTESHYVYVEGGDRECLDSTTLVNLALKYRDTSSTPNPITNISFYMSRKYFLRGEVSQPMQDISKDCLFSITISKSGEPTNFAFYNNSGDLIYWGRRWNTEGW